MNHQEVLRVQVRPLPGEDGAHLGRVLDGDGQELDSGGASSRSAAVEKAQAYMRRASEIEDDYWEDV